MLSNDASDETPLHRAGETWAGSWLLEQFHSRVKEREVTVLICIHLYLTCLARRNAALLNYITLQSRFNQLEYCEQLDIRNKHRGRSGHC